MSRLETNSWGRQRWLAGVPFEDYRADQNPVSEAQEAFAL